MAPIYIPTVEEFFAMNSTPIEHDCCTYPTHYMAPTFSKEDVALCMCKLKAIGNPLDIKEGDLEVGMKICKDGAKLDVESIYRAHLEEGGEAMKEIRAEGEQGKGDAGENWGTWQRMGGDSRMTKEFDLSRVPYKSAGSMKWVESGADKDDDTIKSAGEEGGAEMEMAPAMSPARLGAALMMMRIDKIEIEKKVKASEPVSDAAKGFNEEDDEAFIPNIVRPASARFDPKQVDALRGSVSQHKKVETLRAIGLEKILSPVVLQSSLVNNSPYLKALGSSGIAPPPGLYNNFSAMAGTAASGLPTQNPYQAAINQSASSSPLTHWSQLETVPTLGFYDTMPLGGDMGMNMGGQRSSLGHIVRNASRAGVHSSVGGGTPLRADSPAFYSTASTSRTIFSPPGFGLQGQHVNTLEAGRTGLRVNSLQQGRTSPIKGSVAQTQFGYDVSGEGLDAVAKNLKTWLS